MIRFSRGFWRGLDWKLVAWLVGLAAVGIVWSVVQQRGHALNSAIEQGKELTGVVKSQSAQIDGLRSAVVELSHDSAERSKAATAERRRLLRLLKANGIDVPPTPHHGATSPGSGGGGSTPGHTAPSPPHKPKPSPHPPSPSPSPSCMTLPMLPGLCIPNLPSSLPLLPTL